ncbi:hypothetical protein B0T26DRAFT_778567 [Lasiosphaeria miniovina]|uniref:Uncharacterized protein n=1 Tax=Lasiosphaeria miniovina TaxID=1954250 RepID=A0AA40AMA5_9PEZI|nr:uncharacterized protein B0T26DRAFT_778567 [Lasiosphaeria miniovina]KAK0718454.1 hypothetical protein B0T26DRAFT_778567 [Lasiosphaeria miniovina]
MDPELLVGHVSERGSFQRLDQVAHQQATETTSCFGATCDNLHLRLVAVFQTEEEVGLQAAAAQTGRHDLGGRDGTDGSWAALQHRKCKSIMSSTVSPLRVRLYSIWLMSLLAITFVTRVVMLMVLGSLSNNGQLGLLRERRAVTSPFIHLGLMALLSALSIHVKDASRDLLWYFFVWVVPK